jgi:chromosome partitioning protein
MPVVVIASPKGGAGKSTAAVLLGTELARAGAKVTMLDCDPNGSLSLWAGRAPLPPRISVLSDIGESAIVKTIKAHDADGAIVIVDLEGVASRLVSRAISQADLVITPMRATTLDATIGVRAIALIAEEEEALDRSIRHAVVFTMTRAIRSKQHNAIEKSLTGQGVDILQPPLMERTAFSALFEFGGDLSTMPPQGRMEGALDNAAGFAEAVYARLKAAMAPEAAR